MWEINSNLQALTFLYAVLMGGMYSLIYDIFKAYRIKYKPSGIFIFFQDIIYSAIISVVSFCFFLVFVNGEIRSYILLGFLIGFVIFRLTISRIILFVFGFVFKIINLIFSYLNCAFLFLERVFGKFFIKIEKFLKNIANRLKKLLKRQKGLLYTMKE